ncbi:hypothetical protein OIDMADRAFT_17023 [Oidiodendron maius Zn]|uniref:Uncharacterized protein n=1 Tax=Oidiodendron maius (strain Zn) TaxID=913774 RepID=A0A0C3HUB2_OIDMZ|nr:hypothetical protein OIDMADRAFT_17023 [Oidiodendron maius Zn]
MGQMSYRMADRSRPVISCHAHLRIRTSCLMAIRTSVFERTALTHHLITTHRLLNLRYFFIVSIKTGRRKHFLRPGREMRGDAGTR